MTPTEQLQSAITRLDADAGEALVMTLPRLFATAPRFLDAFARCLATPQDPPPLALQRLGDADVSQGLTAALMLARCSLNENSKIADVSVLVLETVAAEAAVRLLARGVAGNN